MTKPLTLRDGRTPSVYGFACGYIDKRDFGNDNRVTLFREHGCYHIKGFEDGKLFWISHRFICDARETFRCVAARMRYNRAVKGKRT